MDSKVGAAQAPRAYSQTKRQSELMVTSTWNLLAGLIVPLCPSSLCAQNSCFCRLATRTLDAAFSQCASPDLGRMLTPPLPKMVFLYPKTSIPSSAGAAIQLRT